MRGLIWYKNKNVGLERFEHLIDEYEKSGIGIKEYKKNSINPYVVFNNDDYWTLVGTKESSRGYRSNINYVERSIDPETYRALIARTNIAFPYHGVAFYGEGDLHISNNKPTFAVNKCEFKVDEYANRPFKGK